MGASVVVTGAAVGAGVATGAGVLVHRPLERTEIDHFKLDIHLVDEHGLAAGRPFLTTESIDAIGDEILEHWGDRIENIAFESEEEAARYYRRAGCEFLKWPFGFAVKDLR